MRRMFTLYVRDLGLILGSDHNQPDLTVIVWAGAVVLIGTSGVGGLTWDIFYLQSKRACGTGAHIWALVPDPQLFP